MKYPAGISGAEYAAMEEGYEQGRESMRAECDRRIRVARAEAWQEGKDSEHTIQCRLGDGDCICLNPYSLAGKSV